MDEVLWDKPLHNSWPWRVLWLHWLGEKEGREDKAVGPKQLFRSGHQDGWYHSEPFSDLCPDTGKAREHWKPIPHPTPIFNLCPLVFLREVFPSVSLRTAFFINVPISFYPLGSRQWLYSRRTRQVQVKHHSVPVDAGYSHDNTVEILQDLAAMKMESDAYPFWSKYMFLWSFNSNI